VKNTNFFVLQAIMGAKPVELEDAETPTIQFPVGYKYTTDSPEKSTFWLLCYATGGTRETILNKRLRKGDFVTFQGRLTDKRTRTWREPGAHDEVVVDEDMEPRRFYRGEFNVFAVYLMKSSDEPTEEEPDPPQFTKGPEKPF
jgi:hypothetical protein